MYIHVTAFSKDVLVADVFAQDLLALSFTSLISSPKIVTTKHTIITLYTLESFEISCAYNCNLIYTCNIQSQYQLAQHTLKPSL